MHICMCIRTCENNLICVCAGHITAAPFTLRIAYHEFGAKRARRRKGRSISSIPRVDKVRQAQHLRSINNRIIEERRNCRELR